MAKKKTFWSWITCTPSFIHQNLGAWLPVLCPLSNGMLELDYLYSVLYPTESWSWITCTPSSINGILELDYLYSVLYSMESRSWITYTPPFIQWNLGAWLPVLRPLSNRILELDYSCTPSLIKWNLGACLPVLRP